MTAILADPGSDAFWDSVTPLPVWRQPRAGSPCGQPTHGSRHPEGEMGIEDKAKAKGQEAAGTAKEKAGEATGDEQKQEEGRAEQLKGKARETAEDARRTAEEAAEEARKRLG